MQLSDGIVNIAGKGHTVFNGDASDSFHNFGFCQYHNVVHPKKGFQEYIDKMSSYLWGPTFFSRVLDDTYQSDHGVPDHPELYEGPSFDSTFSSRKKNPIFSAALLLRRSPDPIHQDRRKSHPASRHARTAQKLPIRPVHAPGDRLAVTGEHLLLDLPPLPPLPLPGVYHGCGEDGPELQRTPVALPVSRPGGGRNAVQSTRKLGPGIGAQQHQIPSEVGMPEQAEVPL